MRDFKDKVAVGRRHRHLQRVGGAGARDGCEVGRKASTVVMDIHCTLFLFFVWLMEVGVSLARQILN